MIFFFLGLLMRIAVYQVFLMNCTCFVLCLNDVTFLEFSFTKCLFSVEKQLRRFCLIFM